MSANNDGSKRTTHTPWIGDTVDGRRDVVSLCDQYGRRRFVHVEAILLDCDLWDSAEEARAWAARLGLSGREALL